MNPSQRNKLKSTFNKVETNKNLLKEKTKTYKHLSPPLCAFKNERVLYDSDWIEPGILEETILGNQNAYFWYNSSTVKKEQQVPFELNYTLKHTLNVPENWLSFIKPVLLVQPSPEVSLEGIFPFQYYEYGANYWKIYGDETKIYQGVSPTTTVQSETRRIAGDFNAALCSKWYYGSCEYNISGTAGKMENGYVVGIKTYYDVVELAGFPSVYSSKSFECMAIDGISASVVNGTGTYTVTTATDNGDGSYTQTSVITKNVTMTAPLFEDYTILQLSGSRYSGGMFQQFHLDTNPYTVYIQGNLGGNATLINFIYTWTNYWKLFYSNKRAKQFRFNTSTRIPYNLPTTTDYQTGSLPYTKIYIDENPTGYPVVQIRNDGLTEYEYGYDKKMWTKTGENQFTFRTSGRIILSGPAKQESTTPIEFVDEDYSQNLGTYTRDSENREEQNKPLYFPNGNGTKIKLLIVFSNPINDNSNFKYEI
jgi:hypothetical protein